MRVLKWPSSHRLLCRSPTWRNIRSSKARSFRGGRTRIFPLPRVREDTITIFLLNTRNGYLRAQYYSIFAITVSAICVGGVKTRNVTWEHPSLEACLYQWTLLLKTLLFLVHLWNLSHSQEGFPLRNCRKLIHNLILSIASVFRFAIFAPYLVTSREDGHNEQ